jgi:L-2-hydroxyglutarate oxidase
MKKIGIIGAGIVGLATAYKLQQKYPHYKIIIIEKESDITQHQTGRNSGVIHSGIYYTPNSLKANNCRNGYQQLLQFCNDNEVAYDICGKLIVATQSKELPTLQMLFERGAKNQLENLQWLNTEQIKEIEPHVEGINGIWVPQTGIIDYKVIAKKMLNLLLTNNAQLFLKEKVVNIKQNNQVEIITTKQTHLVDLVYNCSGLYADKLAKKTSKIDYKIIPFRGEYYQLKPEKEFLVNNLIYPVPNPEFPFLGVHFTRRISGGIEAGPNAVLAFGRESYQKTQINFPELFETLSYPGFLKVAQKYWRDGAYEMYRSWSKNAFTKALQRLIPEINKEDLIPANSGIRAQAVNKKGELIDDFLILRENNVIHIGNAPSPAATASLAIADTLVSLLD